MLVAALTPNTFYIIKANILIDRDGHARLADFGLLTIISDPKNFTVSSSYAICGTTRWMSPELLNPHQQISPESLWRCGLLCASVSLRGMSVAIVT